MADKMAYEQQVKKHGLSGMVLSWDIIEVLTETMQSNHLMSRPVVLFKAKSF